MALSLNTLSNELLGAVVSHLDAPAAICLALSSKQFRELIHSLLQPGNSYSYKDLLLDADSLYFNKLTFYQLPSAAQNAHTAMMSKAMVTEPCLDWSRLQTLPRAEYGLMLQLKNSSWLKAASAQRSCLVRGHCCRVYTTPFLENHCKGCDQFFDTDDPEARLRLFTAECFHNGFSSWCHRNHIDYKWRSDISAVKEHVKNGTITQLQPPPAPPTPPAPSMLHNGNTGGSLLRGTSPIDGQRRNYQACERCRKRKLKCDLGPVEAPHAPPCARCRRENKHCIFADEHVKCHRRGGGRSLEANDMAKDARERGGGTQDGNISLNIMSWG